MKRTLVAVCLALVVPCSAQVADGVLAHVTVLTAPDARAQVLDRTRVASQLGQILSYLRVPAEQLPNIVVIYANAQAARIDALPEGAKVTVARINFQDASLYQVWVTGQASDANTVQGLIWALNRHYALHLGEAQINDVRDHIVRQMNELVSAGDLARKHH